MAAAPVLALLPLASPAQATRVAGPDAKTITVCDVGCDYQTIQAASSWAEAGDTISINSSFEILPLPAPGAIALFGFAGLIGRRRRRA